MFADDSAIFATHEDPMIASLNLQSTYQAMKGGFRSGKSR
jgi:hypothetical protein